MTTTSRTIKVSYSRANTVANVIFREGSYSDIVGMMKGETLQDVIQKRFVSGELPAGWTYEIVATA